MFKELLYFINGYPDNFGFELDDDVLLSGLKFSSQENYLWKKKKEMISFFEKLYSDESIESYRKIIHWNTILYHERIHICYSRALILRISFVMMFFTVLILIALTNLVHAIFFSGIAILMLIGDFIYRKKAGNYRKSFILTTGLLKMLIEDQLEKSN